METAVYIYAYLTVATALFQLGLAAGMPWGEMTMAGKFPGVLPPQMRFAAIVQALLLLLFAGSVLAYTGITFSHYRELSGKLIWPIFAFSIIACVLNTITPSRKERLLWAPVTYVLLVCLIVIIAGKE